MSIRGTLVLLGSLFILSALLFIFWWRTPGFVLYGNVVQVAALTLGAVSMTRAAAASAQRGAWWKSWGWISGGAWMWVIGQVWEALAELVLKMSAYGTVADAFWVVGFSMFLTGLAGLLRDRASSGRELNGKFKALISVLGLAIILVLLVSQHRTNSERDGFRMVLDYVYPALNLGVLYCSMVLLFSSRVEQDTPQAIAWEVYALSFTLGTALDVTWSYLSETNSFLYRFQDLTYFLNFSLLAIASLLHQKRLEAPT